MTLDRLRCLSVARVGELLEVSPDTVYRLVASGELPALKIRGALRVPLCEGEKYIDRQQERFALENGIAE
ncbi:MAG: helix-turn-helix domain-containing protein [Deltaproteobacteria bacterium]|nr:helix-turn-helix domain-containing protein [Deltaproteobacteria bacterium]